MDGPDGIKRARMRSLWISNITRIGMDTSKHIFELHGVTAAGDPVLRKKLLIKAMQDILQGEGHPHREIPATVGYDKLTKPAVTARNFRG